MPHYFALPRKWARMSILVAWMATSNAHAQSELLFDPYSREPLPAGSPTWMQEIAADPAGVSYRKMDSLFNHWLATDNDARVKTLDRKPAVNFYRRWMKAYRPYVGGDGYIHLPTMQEHMDRLEQQNRRTTHLQMTRSASAPQWRNIGPNSTIKGHSPYETTAPNQPKDAQACVYRISVSPTHPNIVYCGTEMGVVFKTTDKGLTWKPCNALHNFGGHIFALQVDPQNPDIVYVGGGQNFWKSTDGGQSWVLQKGIVGRVNSIRISPHNSQHLTICTGIIKGEAGGFYTSTDGGQSYNLTFKGVCHDHELQPGNPKRIYMVAKPSDDYEFFIYVSDDAGVSFQKVQLPISSLAAGRLAVSEAPGGQNHVYALVTTSFYGTDNGPYGGMGTPYILKSTDAGQTWENPTETGNTGSYKTTFSPFLDSKQGGQGYFDMMIGVSPKDPEHVIYGLCSAYRDLKGGKGWYRDTAIGGYQNRDGMHPDMQDIAICGEDTWICTDGGIKYSDNFFETYGQDRHFGIYASEYVGFGQGWNEDVIVGGRHHNANMVQMAKHEGKSFHLGGGETPTGYVLLSNPRKIGFSDTTPKNVLVPEDWKEPFVALPDFLKYPYEDSHSGIGLEFDPRYAKSFLLFSGFYSDERGILWKTVDDGQSFVQLHKFPNSITSHSIARSNPDKIVVSIRGGLYQSLDGGQTFTAYANIPQEVRNALNTITAIHPRNENEIWVAVTDEAGDIFRSKDNGQTWEKLREGLDLPINSPLYQSATEKVSINRFFLTGNEKNAVYAIAYVMRPAGIKDTYFPRGRVFYRDDTTNGWQDFSEGLPSVITLTRMLPFYKEGKIRIATNNGVWQRDLVDAHFKPIAQPLILNVGKGDNPGETELHFDSYSIVNQKNATWEWKFNPQPLHVSNPKVRNPIVRIAADQSYDVTLTVTTPEGSDTKTVKKMIAGKKDVITSIAGQEVLKHDILLSTHICTKGEAIVLPPQGLDADCKWQLFNTAGKLVNTQNIAVVGSTPIATQTLTPGTYFYLLTNRTFKKTGKIIIQ